MYAYARACSDIVQALLSVFRGRVDRNKDTAVERCDMELHEDPQQAECRLTVKMICGLGMFCLVSVCDCVSATNAAVRRDQIVQAHLRTGIDTARRLRQKQDHEPVDGGSAVSEADY